MSDPSLAPTYGALFIGVMFATFFQGVLSVQAYVYYENFPEDTWKMKSLVGGVWCVDMLHLVLIGQATYHYLVTNWGNPASLAFSVWTFDAHLVLLGIATVMCQSFFLRRIWLFSNKSILLLILLIAICLATFALDIFMSVKDMMILSVTEFQILKPEVTALFSISAASDVVIAILLCYYLRRGGSGFEKTNSIISHLVRYTVTTGLATSMLAVACLVAYFARPNTFIFIGMHFSLGRMYTNALLATLNSRRSLRAAVDTHSGPNRNAITKAGTSFQTTSRGGPTVAYRPGHVSLQLEPDFEPVPSPQYVYKSSVNDDRDSTDIELQAVRDGFKAAAM
ncbi:hypothetical protein K439DRAFT_1625956 [Ramaria rubella]|nr:hypothetical protein K439DRAFT_1625956 [Ramaria rubella]